ncbi:EamA family transporter, partial [Timonella senegalensis]|uniref:EamA family transporter n=1 Tax=Timonella senegalensis TaxID=1465825 RepID=UPI0028AF7471
ERLHLGVTVTIEVLGPMVLSIVLARRWLNVLWVALAVGGVALLSQGPVALDPVGVAFALVAATMWALYILSAQRAGREFPGMDGLAIAMGVGSLAILPFAAVSTGATLIQPNILLLGLGIALLSSTLPYAMELFALKRIPASLFSILLAFAPAVAALAGWAVLGQTMVWAQWAGTALVIGASVGAVRMTRRQGLDA